MTLEAAAETYKDAERATAAARAALYRSIQQAHRRGQSVRKIAALTGLSAARVHQVIQGRN